MYEKILMPLLMIICLLGCVSTPKWTPLHEAVTNGDLETVQKLLKGKADIDRPGLVQQDKPQDILYTLKTPLGIAIEQDNKEVFDLLINAGADPANALVPAVFYGRAEYLDRCLGLIVTIKGFHWGSGPRKTLTGIPQYEQQIDKAVGLAAKRGKSAMLEVFFKYGMDANKILNSIFARVTQDSILNSGVTQEYIDNFPIKNFDYIPAFHIISIAAICGQNSTVDFLLKHNANPNAYARIPIHFDQRLAPEGRHFEPIQLRHMGPLQWAALTKNEEMLYLLLENGAEPTQTTLSMLKTMYISPGYEPTISEKKVLVDDPEKVLKLKRMQDALKAKMSTK